jgi:hypothetical protein
MELEKINSVKNIKEGDILIAKGCYPIKVMCIDGRNEKMMLFLECLLNQNSYKYTFEFVNNIIKNNSLFKIVNKSI